MTDIFHIFPIVLLTTELSVFFPKEGPHIMMSQLWKRICWRSTSIETWLLTVYTGRTSGSDKNRHRAQLVISLAARVCTKNSRHTSVLLLTAVEPVSAKNCPNCAQGLPSWMPVGYHPDQQGFCNFHWTTGSPVMDHYQTKTNRGLWQIMPFRRHCRRTEVDMQ